MARFCKGVEPGEGRLSTCLTQQLEEESKGNVQGAREPPESRLLRHTRASVCCGDLGAGAGPMVGRPGSGIGG